MLCKQAVSTGTTEVIANEQRLLQAGRTGQPLLKSLFHPRWWLHGPPVVKSFIPWKPVYGECLSRQRISRRELTISRVRYYKLDWPETVSHAFQRPGLRVD
jgi:hypothetical protein